MVSGSVVQACILLLRMVRLFSHKVYAALSPPSFYYHHEPEPVRIGHRTMASCTSTCSNPSCSLPNSGVGSHVPLLRIESLYPENQTPLQKESVTKIAESTTISSGWRERECGVGSYKLQGPKLCSMTGVELT